MTTFTISSYYLDNAGTDEDAARVASLRARLGTVRGVRVSIEGGWLRLPVEPRGLDVEGVVYALLRDGQCSCWGRAAEMEAAAAAIGPREDYYDERIPGSAEEADWCAFDAWCDGWDAIEGDLAEVLDLIWNEG